MTSEEKIQLPDFLIAELYKGNLVDLDTFNAKEERALIPKDLIDIKENTKVEGKIKYLGENGKGVIVLVDQAEAVFLKENELTFLTNILNACHLSLADIAIINIAKQEINYETITKHLTVSTILLFDVEPSAIRLPFMIPVFQVQMFDECTVMVSPSLSVINKPTQEGKLLKTKLWMSLKKIFNII